MCDPFIGASIIGAGTSIFGGKKAASAIGNASAGSVAEQRRQFDIATGLSRPAIQAGDAAREQLLRLLGIASPNAPTAAPAGPSFGAGPYLDFEGTQIPNPFYSPGGATAAPPAQPVSANPIDVIKNTPGYQFQLDQGARALNVNRGAGGISGGEVLKDFSRFNQGVASNFYRDYADRLANLSGTAANASLQAGNQAIQSGQNIGNTLQNAGIARASGILGTSGSITKLIEQLAQGYGSGVFGGKTGTDPTEILW